MQEQYPMITKIISGGQTGVDRAGLDVARQLKIEWGGYCPKGRRAEDGVIPTIYRRLVETKSTKYQVRTEMNVQEADATLIVTWGKPTGGTALTAKLCEKHSKPYFVADLQETPLARVCSWLEKVRPKVLNVAGPRQSSFPLIDVQERARTFIMNLMFMQPR